MEVFSEENKLPKAPTEWQEGNCQMRRGFLTFRLLKVFCFVVTSRQSRKKTFWSCWHLWFISASVPVSVGPYSVFPAFYSSPYWNLSTTCLSCIRVWSFSINSSLKLFLVFWGAPDFLGVWRPHSTFDTLVGLVSRHFCPRSRWGHSQNQNGTAQFWLDVK